MPDSWEVRINRIIVNDDQSQMFEQTFQQRIDVEPDLQPIIDAYGPSVQAPPPDPEAMMRSMPMPGASPPAVKTR